MAGNYTIQANTALSAFIDGENLAVDLDQKRRLNAAQLEQLMMSNEIMRATAQSQVDAALLANEQVKMNIQKTTQDIAASRASVGIAMNADRRQQDIHAAGAYGRQLESEMAKLGLEWAHDPENRRLVLEGKSAEIAASTATNQYTARAYGAQMDALLQQQNEALGVPPAGAGGAGGGGGSPSTQLRSSGARTGGNIPQSFPASPRVAYNDAVNLRSTEDIAAAGAEGGLEQILGSSDNPDIIDAQKLTTYRSPQVMGEIGRALAGAELIGRGGRYRLASGQVVDMRRYMPGTGFMTRAEFDSHLATLQGANLPDMGLAYNVLSTYGISPDFINVVAAESLYGPDRATSVADLASKGLPEEQIAATLSDIRDGARYATVTSVDGDKLYVYRNPNNPEAVYASKTAPFNMRPVD